jgi:hypothetical protein
VRRSSHRCTDRRAAAIAPARQPYRAGQRLARPLQPDHRTGEQGKKPVPILDVGIRRRDIFRAAGAAIVARGWAADMKHGASRELYEYWNRVRGDERAPHRGAIEPSDIRRILADTFILEVVDRSTHLIRLAGTRVCSIYCRELKGTNFFDLWRADDRSAMATLAAAVSEDGAAAVITLEGKTERHQDIAAELLLLPLRHTGSAFDRVLGSLAVLDRPYWLGSEPVTRQTIASLRLIWPDEVPRFMRRRADGAALPNLRLLPTASALPATPRRRGHLVVFDGGKD